MITAYTIDIAGMYQYMRTVKEIIKSIYTAIPFKKQLFSQIKKFYIPRKYKSLFFKGSFVIQVNKNVSFLMNHYNHYGIETEYFWKGLPEAWETFSTSLWIELCKNSDVIFDIGASMGIYSLIAKSLRPESKVFAFEPLDTPYKQLAANNEINGYDIACNETAVSNHEGTARLFVNLDSNGISAEGTLNQNHFSAQDAKPSSIVVRTNKLSTIIEEMNIQKIDLMKIDVETLEPEVLKGLGAYLDKFKPSILVEVLSDEIGKQIENIITGRGYLYFNINDDSRNGPKGARMTKNITKSDCLNYLLCSEKTAKSLKLIS